MLGRRQLLIRNIANYESTFIIQIFSGFRFRVGASYIEKQYSGISYLHQTFRDGSVRMKTVSPTGVSKNVWN